MTLETGQVRVACVPVFPGFPTGSQRPSSLTASFTDGDTEAQSRKMACLRVQSRSVRETGFMTTNCTGTFQEEEAGRRGCVAPLTKCQAIARYFHVVIEFDPCHYHSRQDIVVPI